MMIKFNLNLLVKNGGESYLTGRPFAYTGNR